MLPDHVENPYSALHVTQLHPQSNYHWDPEVPILGTFFALVGTFQKEQVGALFVCPTWAKKNPVGRTRFLENSSV